MSIRKKMLSNVAVLVLLLCFCGAQAQTDNDAIMMKKRQWCNGFTYMYSGWDHYWEGALKRNNQNIGKYTSQEVMYMTNYGITDKLNVIAGLPYVWTHVTAGTLHGLKGFQDASLFIKWKPLAFKFGKAKLSFFTVGGVSTPVTKYEVDFQPMSVGLGTTNLTGRLTGDLQVGMFYTTFSAAYVWRSNVKIDRTSYYTTQIHNTNEVEMPNMNSINWNIGIRRKYLTAEILVEKMTTLGGFDIRRNDMPFVSNKMDMTSVGVHAKYTLPFFTHIEILGGGGYVVKGRNVGQATMFHAGAYYIFKL